jgi:Ca2+-binding EF-hand superfamily protein
MRWAALLLLACVCAAEVGRLGHRAEALDWGDYGCAPVAAAQVEGAARTSSGTVVHVPGTRPACSIRLAIHVDGQPPDVAWQRFVDRLFEHFDQDRDGSLSRAEAAHMPPLPLAGRQELTIDYATLDRNGKGAATKSDLAAFCRDGGFVPVVVVVEAASDDDRRLAALFARVLGLGPDGRVTTAALRRLVDSLRSSDLNDDEVWEASELLASAPAHVAQQVGTPGAVRNDDTAATLRLFLGSKADASLSQEKPVAEPLLVLTKQVAGTCRLNGPQGRWSATFRPALDSPDLRSSAQFLAAQFQAALGAAPTLAKAHVDADPLLGALRSLFPYADRNQDSALSPAELTGYLELIELAAAAQVWITVRDFGGNLFPALDADGDGRLSCRELTGAPHVLAGAEVESPVLPRQLELSFRALQSRRWGGVAIPGYKRSPQPDASVSAGPRWFRAQDVNRDGVVSRREFVSTPELFRHLDKDGDGLISPPEALGDAKP